MYYIYSFLFFPTSTAEVWKLLCGTFEVLKQEKEKNVFEKNLIFYHTLYWGSTETEKTLHQFIYSSGSFFVRFVGFFQGFKIIQSALVFCEREEDKFWRNGSSFLLSKHDFGRSFSFIKIFSMEGESIMAWERRLFTKLDVKHVKK